MLNVFVRRNYLTALRALEDGDLDTLLKNFGPECELTYVGGGGLRAHRLTGRDLRQWFERYIGVVVERRVQVTRFASSGPLWRRQVAAHVLISGRLADGTAYRSQFSHFLLVRNGRIVDDLVLEDAAAWAAPHASTAPPQGAVDLAAKLATIDRHWSPGIVAEANDWQLKLVKVSGTFVWHDHEVDEVFLVLSGRLTIELEGRDDVPLGPGELLVVPRGARHRPVAGDGECAIMLIEPRGVVNTGNAGGELTAPERWL
ncbi:mannose-6-phosphate isomerase-like protein (cupin superfamily)/ketosteroid isomerase-like protein [Nocardioides cavernae]|uniref:Mannose-6-phosphate isomerase-like protein (Cupin superfamily)/ketosteroid isomerase-like protein n=1 Tax=Nocardioides cavernae TaxID=1921566 RepID=A0A7Y9KRJ0_9ACTN|nr:cupin domain-containing protein [Nocardioides cavernae]NYE35352.1 mannose-6-phosphate isomerase-like protein (cupin superfamily)/ketosteroid isomerase-like protein [Nocardioides cavernae]